MSTKTFNEESTALEVIEGHDLTGREAIVTGAASGIGVETVRALAKAGARVIIATRDLNKANEVAEQLRKETGSNKIEAERLDLASLKSVHEFSKNFLAKNRPLHYLVNNAGIMACPLGYTEDGSELHMGTNHFGHFALTLDLIPSLKEGAKQSGKNARVVNLSSMGHGLSDIVFDDIHYKKRPYDPFGAYGQSKTANALFSVGLTKRYAKDGIYSNAVMPGGIITGLMKHMTDDLKKKIFTNEDGTPKALPKLKTVEQGAATTIWACVAPELENRGGLYLNDCAIAPFKDLHEMQEALSKTIFIHGVAKYALDEQSADKLWSVSEKTVGLA